MLTDRWIQAELSRFLMGINTHDTGSVLRFRTNLTLINQSRPRGTNNACFMVNENFTWNC